MTDIAPRTAAADAVAADRATVGSAGRALVADREVAAVPAVDTAAAVGTKCLVEAGVAARIAAGRCRLAGVPCLKPSTQLLHYYVSSR